ncbi:DUF192 domain-containing protein [candidate division KSB1 bacterium]|nr:DUF192 domain-containing protein [candidate division KSB1 bacterium]
MKGKKKKVIVWIGLPILLLVIVTLALEHKTDKGKNQSFTFYDFTRQGELLFRRNDRILKKIDIEIADSEYKIILGLMFRKEMQENQGMLFLFDNEEPRSFWMKDTYISLDILFADASKKIVTIHKYTTPFTTNGYASTEPAQYVVEVISGFTDKYNIKTGDTIEWVRANSDQ